MAHWLAVLTPVAALLVSIGIAVRAARAGRAIADATAQATTNAAVLGGVSELVDGLREDRRIARLERDQALRERDACRREVARLRKLVKSD